jgi:hypothetical protein
VVRPLEVEIKVLNVVEAVRRGEKVEDDLVECKRDWPDVSKARQLAALCNKARGSDVILIIGLDEATRSVHLVDSTDPATWWSSFQARFDEATPDLLVHQRVDVGDGQSVIALAFDTSRVPFVIKTPANSGPVEREIPIRDGTRTRSAHRREVIQLLAPNLNLPAISFLKASVTVSWHAARDTVEDSPGVAPQSARQERVSLWSQVTVYVEHLVPEFVMLPTHLIEARIKFGNYELPLKARMIPPSRGQDHAPPPVKRYGVDRREEGALITGPGILTVNFDAVLPLERLAHVEGSEEGNIAVDFHVSGGAVPIRVTGSCRRQTPRSSDSWPTGRQVRFVSS